MERALQNLGFARVRHEGTHERWEAVRGDRKYKVTVDCHRGEVRDMDVKSIIGQAGVTKREFFDAMNRD